MPKAVSRKIYLEDIPLDEARAVFQAALAQAGLWQPLASEEIPVAQAHGRVTAAAVFARLSSPHYHASAMDGYAVRAQDSIGATETTPLPLTLVTEFDPQTAVPGFRPAQAVNTGNPLPAWANAVVMIEHTQSITDQDVVFDRFSGYAAAFFNITSTHVLALRALIQTTANRGDAPIPFYLYPYLDFNKLGGYRNQRLIDYDSFNVTAEYRWPIINLIDLYQVSTFVQAGLGGVYFDIWNEFDPSVTFKKDLEAGTYPLRPGFGIGLRVSGLEQQIDYIQWLLGVGPEGFTLFTFKFVVEIGEIR